MRLRHAIGAILRWGVILSAAVVQIGGIAYLIRHGGELADYGRFQGQPSGLRTVGGIAAGALKFQSRSVIQLGLLILIATPVARVVFSLAAFISERDRTYIAITSIVLATLVYSLAWGHP